MECNSSTKERSSTKLNTASGRSDLSDRKPWSSDSESLKLKLRQRRRSYFLEVSFWRVSLHRVLVYALPTCVTRVHSSKPKSAHAECYRAWSPRSRLLNRLVLDDSISGFRNTGVTVNRFGEAEFL